MRARIFVGMLLALGLLAGLAAAQTQPPARLTHDQAVKDARTFVRLLEESHPDPYTNLGGKVAFERKAQQLIRDIPAEGLSVPELRDRLAAFTAPLKDGHTRVSGRSEGWADDSPKLAVKFQIAADGLLISGSDLPQLKGLRGARLVAVNGVTVDQLLDRLAAKLAVENQYGAYSGLSAVLRSSKLLKNLLPDLDGAAGVTYSLETPAGKKVESKITWEGVHPDDPQKWAEPPQRWSGLDRSDDQFYYRFLPGGQTAYFRVANFMPREGYEIVKRYHVGNLKEMLGQYYKRHKQPMPDDLDAALAGLPSLFEQGTNLLNEMMGRKTPNLIIDLRGNGGGSTPTFVPFMYQLYGDDYFGRAAGGDFVQVRSALYLEKYNSSAEEEHKKDPNFQVGEYVFSHNYEGATPEEKRLRRLADFQRHEMSFTPALEKLNGKPLYSPRKVVVLCDPGVFSAAFQAMFLLHQAGATVVGVPSAQSPNAFMEATPFVLPESGIPGSISNGVQMFMPADPRANVFHPNFEVTYSTFKKYGFDEDTGLRYAVDLLAAGKI
jgi:hypothetical protein